MTHVHVRHPLAHDKQLNVGATRQSGMVLLLCLIFMTALTMLGLSATSDTLLQRQLANNLHEAEFAKQAGHLAHQWTENWISQLPSSAMTTCDQSCSGFYTHPTGSLGSGLESEPVSTWRLKGFEAGLDPATGVRLQTFGMSAVEPPMWIVEYLHHSPAVTGNSDPANNTPEQHWYRILVRSTGRSENTVSVFESVIVRSETDSSQTAASSVTTKRVSWQELR